MEPQSHLSLPEHATPVAPPHEHPKKTNPIFIIMAMVFFLTTLAAIGFIIYQQTQISSLQNQLSQIPNVTPAPIASPQATPVVSFITEDIMAAPNMRARDTRRRADLIIITSSIYQYASEHNGNLPGTNGEDNFPTTPTCIGQAPECFNLAGAGGTQPIVPTYIQEIPKDPSTGTEANTGYIIYSNNGRLTATATGELEPEITVIR